MTTEEPTTGLSDRDTTVHQSQISAVSLIDKVPAPLKTTVLVHPSSQRTTMIFDSREEFSSIFLKVLKCNINMRRDVDMSFQLIGTDLSIHPRMLIILRNYRPLISSCDDNATEKAVCFYHNKSGHVILNCRAFVNLKYNKRKQFAFKNKLCFLCLDNHFNNQCANISSQVVTNARVGTARNA